MIEIAFDNRSRTVQPRVSVIVVDWSCRESFHVLKYLNEQSAAREDYEVVWIEYYGARPKALETAATGVHPNPMIDRWIIMNMPGKVYYHKHLMYNAGLIAARGEIIVICDSDAVLRPSFIKSIIKTFEDNPGVVLHLDQVRNNDKRFYPFNYPPVDEILGKGCLNWKDGKTTGLLDMDDELHARNYGACFCAKRRDIINIGGADEHDDYLGHVCGPYEMTFRLRNAGLKIIWHDEEFLYHVWHPGTDGEANYMGPHNGRNMSTTALRVRSTRRIKPLVENPAIRAMRLHPDEIIYEPLLNQCVPEQELDRWAIRNLRPAHDSDELNGMFLKNPLSAIRLATTFLTIGVKQFHMKATRFSRQPKSAMDVFRKAFKAYAFVKNMARYNRYVLRSCEECLKTLAAENVKEFALYGTGDVAKVLYRLSQPSPVKVGAVYDRTEGNSFSSFSVRPVNTIRDYKGKVVVATLAGASESAEFLKSMDVDEKNILLL
ncbi:MAG: glycosyltransferase [Deltaproteobacteria bacterium]|nr:glycosyltransferase [Deltaproteobacteria bacterium]